MRSHILSSGAIKCINYTYFFCSFAKNISMKTYQKILVFLLFLTPIGLIWGIGIILNWANYDFRKWNVYADKNNEKNENYTFINLEFDRNEFYRIGIALTAITIPLYCFLFVFVFYELDMPWARIIVSFIILSIIYQCYYTYKIVTLVKQETIYFITHKEYCEKQYDDLDWIAWQVIKSWIPLIPLIFFCIIA